MFELFHELEYLFCYYWYTQISLYISTPKIMTPLPTLPSVYENSERESNPIP